ncbi:MAG: hypothetical protein GY870_13760 [archaeon]|nr:hypothetical protein [archaeon]
MSLDSFMGTGKKKSRKSKKSSSKKSTSKKSLDEEEIKEKKKKKEVGEIIQKGNAPTEEKNDNKTAEFSMITIKLSCTAKCAYKKTIKRPKSFSPREKDLICPKCGQKMKVKKMK